MRFTQILFSFFPACHSFFDNQYVKQADVIYLFIFMLHNNRYSGVSWERVSLQLFKLLNICTVLLLRGSNYVGPEDYKKRIL